MVLFAVASLAIGLSACGGGHTTALKVARSVSSLKGDEDDDDGPGEFTPSPGTNDPDADGDNDAQDNEHKGYFDRDDGSVSGFGQAASGADRRTLIALVDRYYTAASRDDGATACTIIYQPLAVDVPKDYGGATGPAYTKGATTCAAATTRLFRHFHSQLTAATLITGVRLKGSEGLVLLGSTMEPASYIPAMREHGGWRMGSVLPTPLP